jgi:hypothetical protein
LGGVLENDVVCNLVLIFAEIEILDDGGKLGFLRGVAVNTKVELTPTLVGTGKRWLGECCDRSAAGRQ